MNCDDTEQEQLLELQLFLKHSGSSILFTLNTLFQNISEKDWNMYGEKYRDRMIKIIKNL